MDFLFFVLVVVCIYYWLIDDIHFPRFRNKPDSESKPKSKSESKLSVLKAGIPAPDLKSHPELDSVRLDEYRKFKQDYLKSPEWQHKRHLILARDRHCQRCSSKGFLVVHHLSYRNLGNEPLEDLVLLCTSCHDLVHNKCGFPQTLDDYTSKTYPIKD